MRNPVSNKQGGGVSSEEQPPGLSSVLHTEGYTCDHAFTSTQVPAQRCLCLINDPSSGPSPSQLKHQLQQLQCGLLLSFWFGLVCGGWGWGSCWRATSCKLQLLPWGELYEVYYKSHFCQNSEQRPRKAAINCSLSHLGPL